MDRLRKLDYRVRPSSPPSTRRLPLSFLPPYSPSNTLPTSSSSFLPQLAAVHLSDASYLTDPSKYISVLLLSLRTMLQLEMPHVNVLSKMDIVTKMGDLGAFTFFLECSSPSKPMRKSSVRREEADPPFFPTRLSSSSLQPRLLHRSSRSLSDFSAPR